MPDRLIPGHWVKTNVFGAPCTFCDITWDVGCALFIVEDEHGDWAGQACTDCYRTELEERRA